MKPITFLASYHATSRSAMSYIKKSKLSRIALKYDRGWLVVSETVYKKLTQQK